jgi:hypothetical protein
MDAATSQEASMTTVKLFQYMLVSMGVVAILQYLSLPIVKSAGAQPEPQLAAANPVHTARTKKSATPNADRVPVATSQEIKTDKITSLFVRTNDSKRIQLSMLVVYKEDLAQSVRATIGQKVTPLVFSVSTLPNRTAHFDPTLLRFEQHGHVWQPQAAGNTIDFLPMEEGGQFGGAITENQVQQGVILLPAVFDPQMPITLRYGNFHYLARFANDKRICRN